MAVLVVGTVVYFLWRDSDDSGSAQLTVRYRTDAPATTGTAKPWLEVINDSKETVALGDVTLRYYFTADDGAEYGANCVQTRVGCSNITQRIGATAGKTAGADHYLEIGFTRGAGELAPGGTSEAIGLQLYRLDGKKLDQANDRSFDAKATHYAPSKLVTAYHRGALVWGEEPGGGTPRPGRGRSAAAPAGVVFDNFHYSGAADPALAANGWQVRTEGGGPGIASTWSADGVSFPAESSAQGGQALRLRVASDGTEQGTKQAELQSTRPEFFTGTIAARVYFSDKPSSGRTGDHLNQSFFTISPKDKSDDYSELDYEYMPNGGWGAAGPRIDTTSWRSGSGRPEDRVTRFHNQSLQGWHTMMITAMDGKVTYSVDGQTLFSHDGKKYFPREGMGVHFSAWLVDLPFKGSRTWDMKVNWLYYQADRAVPLADVQKAVDGFYADGTNYVNTLPKP
ncbi:hydrolase [Streptomyces sp. UNOC14_S4]|nr:hydrolase [Streptomyces sp. UNOC14_S4]